MPLVITNGFPSTPDVSIDIDSVYVVLFIPPEINSVSFSPIIVQSIALKLVHASDQDEPVLEPFAFLST